MRSSPAYQRGDVGEGLREAFFDMDARALACAEAHLAGATATVAVVRGDKLWVAGVGDSRWVGGQWGSRCVWGGASKGGGPVWVMAGVQTGACVGGKGPFVHKGCSSGVAYPCSGGGEPGVAAEWC